MEFYYSCVKYQTVLLSDVLFLLYYQHKSSLTNHY